MSHYYFLPYDKLDNTIEYLEDLGYSCLAPRFIDGAIKYAQIKKSSDLPWGYTDIQEPGLYKVMPADSLQDKKAFGFTLPSHSVKPLLFKAKEVLWKVTRDGANKLKFEPQEECQKTAVFGVRSCDLRGIIGQDKIFTNNSYNDPRYIKRRESLFIIAANCTDSHYNCFCTAIGDYPKADAGFDLAITEIAKGFVVESGSEKGREFIVNLKLSAASGDMVDKALKGIDNAAQKQHKKLPDYKTIEQKLQSSLAHPEWDDVASRCLSCGSCTNSCPTCFCHTENEEPSLNGQESVHTREWDSCFSIDHSYTHGETYREKPKHRYRQWLTHKFSYWREQFRQKGCVGCGRCVTWCPVKIDVVDEINTICK